MKNTGTIHVDQFLPFSPVQVWKAVTEPDIIARWLMPNDFQLAVGHHITFETTPIPQVKFGGIAYCEILAFEVERSLRIRWIDRSDENGLNSIVTWRLEPEGEETHLFMEHDGFDLNHPLQQLSYQFMSKGLARLPQSIEEILAEDPVNTMTGGI
jgi:uncharacterized protein YndB with AHSA1/START domain